MGIVLEPNEVEKLGAADSLDVIAAHIMSGGHLEDLCTTWKIPYARVRLWMMEDGERDRVYVMALNARAELVTERLNKEMNTLALRDSGGIIDMETGKMLPPSKWPKELFKAIDSFQWDKDTGNLKSIQFASKEGALALAGRALAMFRDKITLDGKLTFEDAVVAADKAYRNKVIDVSPNPAALQAAPATLKGPEGQKP